MRFKRHLFQSCFARCGNKKMTHHQVEEFFKDNFGKGYHPVLHGRCETINPLALLVKQKKKWYNRRANFVAVANLAKYVVEEDRVAHRKLAREKVKKTKNKLGKEEVERLEERANSQEYDFEVEDVIGARYVMSDHPGDLVLGQLDEEYFEDPDLREILKGSRLDKETMKPFDDAQKIYIVTSVIYSDKFKIKGKPEHTDMVSFHANAGELTKLLFPKAIPANISGKRSHTSHPSPWVERKGRGPLLFAYTRVTYSKTDGKLCLNDFVGKDIRARGPPEKQEAYETVVDKEQKELEEFFAIEDLEEKLVNVQTFLLTFEMDKRRELLKTYLKHFDDVLDKNQRLIVIEKPTEEQSKLLQKFGFKVDEDFLKVSKETSHTIRLWYGKIFKLLNGLSHEKWMQFQQCSPNGRDLEDGKQKKRKTQK